MVNIELRTRVHRGCLVVALCGELDTTEAEGAAAEVGVLAKSGRRSVFLPRRAGRCYGC
jgi:hypothetical protein